MAPIYILRGIPLFENLSNDELKHIAGRLHKENYPRGAYVFREGDLGDTMYLVESGRLAVDSSESGDTIANMGPGSFVGEISLLLAEPRTASLRVIIDAELWAFRKRDFEELLATRPEIGLQMMRELSHRLVATTRRKQRVVTRRLTALALAPQTPMQEKVDIGKRLARAINAQLKKPVALLPLGDVGLNPELTMNDGVMMLDNDLLDEALLARSLSHYIETYKHIVMLLPNETNSLSQKAVELADTIIRVGQPSAWLTSQIENKDVWQTTTTPIDLQRIARRLTNRTVGLALSSGGSRGMAHIGVLKVLIEEGIPIDMVAGTSAGAWFGAFFSAGWTVEQFEAFAEEIKTFTKISNWDFNVPYPRTGIVKGRKARDKVIAKTVENRTFEDLQIPLYIVAADILTGDEVVFDSGPLADAIRASLSVPVLTDPWHYQDRYFVDGGIVNPLPASVLRERGIDIVIASSVIRPLRESYSGRTDQMPSILQIVFNMFSAMEAEVVDKQLPLIDVLIQHNISAKHTLDFENVNDFVKMGEDAAREMIPQIKEVLDTPPEV